MIFVHRCTHDLDTPPRSPISLYRLPLLLPRSSSSTKVLLFPFSIDFVCQLFFFALVTMLMMLHSILMIPFSKHVQFRFCPWCSFSTLYLRWCLATQYRLSFAQHLSNLQWSVSFIFHISHPYESTDFASVLYSLTFVLMLHTGEFRVFSMILAGRKSLGIFCDQRSQYE